MAAPIQLTADTSVICTGNDANAVLQLLTAGVQMFQNENHREMTTSEIAVFIADKLVPYYSNFNMTLTGLNAQGGPLQANYP